MIKIKNASMHCNISKKTILDNISLIAKTSQMTMLMGANGSGKSSILKAISGEYRLSKGEIILAEKDITNISKHTRAKKIISIHQNPIRATAEEMTVIEHLAFAYNRGKNRTLKLWESNIKEPMFEEKISWLTTNLKKKIRSSVKTLSLGERQALSLIMAIMSKTDVLLLDEITASLDAKTSEQVMEIAHAITKKEKLITISITHDIKQAIGFGAKIIIISDGKISTNIIKNDNEIWSETNLTKILYSF